ncbi:sulfur carrier protein ThiS [Cetobacterium sp.]|uniref:sulfur carrier protein ThiS n=1 Tax=Cetobacterium sp. TaxID=2071632 RepID=UPI003F380598
MNFKFNGESISLDSTSTIKEFIHSLNLNTDGLIILFNDEIIKKDNLDIVINEGCSIEVLNFVCGG